MHLQEIFVHYDQDMIVKNKKMQNLRLKITCRNAKNLDLKQDNYATKPTLLHKRLIGGRFIETAGSGCRCITHKGYFLENQLKVHVKNYN